MSTIRTSRSRRAVLAVAATVLLASIAALPAAAADGYPYVASTTPADGDIDVAANASLTVTFSEPVEVTDGWFRIDCGTSLEHAAVASGGPVTWTLDPNHDFAAGESCALTTAAALINDPDGLNPLSNGLYAFTIAGEPAAPGAPPPSTFTGFKRPIKALPEVNRAWAGWVVPIRFTLAGDHVRHTFAVGSKRFTCGTTPPSAESVTMVERGRWAVRYNKWQDTYVFGWKTSWAWRHTCRLFVLTVDGGAPQTIAFRFK